MDAGSNQLEKLDGLLKKQKDEIVALHLALYMKLAAQAKPLTNIIRLHQNENNVKKRLEKETRQLSETSSTQEEGARERQLTKVLVATEGKAVQKQANLTPFVAILVERLTPERLDHTSLIQDVQKV